MENQNGTKKSHRGGARVGAGRKRIEGRDIAVTFRISELANERFKTYCKEHGFSRNEAVCRLFEALPIPSVIPE